MFSLNLSLKSKLLSDVNGWCPHLLITASKISWTGASGHPKSYTIHVYIYMYIIIYVKYYLI